MILYGQALALLRDAASARGLTSPETAALAEAVGRVTAAPIVSAEALPPFDNSSMDGYAVRAADTGAAPVCLPVRGTIAAGDAPLTGGGAGAYEIMTGAPMPRGCDSIVPVERVKLKDGGRSVEIFERAEAGDYVRERGRDFPMGAAVLDHGTRLEPRHLLALAALGVERVAVRKRPTVAVISTGKELAAPGRTPEPGQIRNSTAAFLMAVLPEAGAQARFIGCVGDDPAEFQDALKKAAAEKPDLVLTTGAVSMGKHDFIPGVLKELGAETLYHKVSIRPGKPGLAARLKDGPLLIGLPGNPLSTVVGLRFFVVPVLRRLLGLPDERPDRLPLVAAVAKPDGLRCFFKASASHGAVQALAGQASFQVRPLLGADCWLILPEEGDSVAAGTTVEVYPL